jgi:hypothetical protein
MTSYTVKLFTSHNRIPSLQLSADDVLRAAAAAIPYFAECGEHVDTAAAIVVEGTSALAVFRPHDVLLWLREHGVEFDKVERGDSSSADPRAELGEGHIPHEQS